MPRQRLRSLTAIAILCALLPGCGSQGASTAKRSYRPAIEATFLKSCFAANRDRTQAVRQEAICGCTLNSIEGAYSEPAFVAIDAAMRGGKKPPATLTGFIHACVASLTVRVHPS